MKTFRVVSFIVFVLAFTGCSSFYGWITGSGSADPSIALKSAESRWLLVKNSRFGDVASEPEYIWVEEDKVPFSFKGMLSKRLVIAPPEVVAQYGPPPGGGKISAQQGLSYMPSPLAPTAAAPSSSATDAPRAITAPSESGKRGFVVWADTTRVAIDLTARDGVKPGALISLRRDRIPIVHPVTGEVLGDLEDEVATARVIELKDKFSVAEIQTLAPGAHVQVKDRAVVK